MEAIKQNWKNSFNLWIKECSSTQQYPLFYDIFSSLAAFFSHWQIKYSEITAKIDYFMTRLETFSLSLKLLLEVKKKFCE